MMSPTRREYIKTVGSIGVAGVVGTAGCLGGGDGGGGGDDREVSFGLVPVEADVDVTDQWAALFEHLEEETDASIEPNQVADYSALLQAVRSDRVDVAGTPHSIAVIGDRMEVSDVVGLRRIAGSDREFSFLTTMPDDGVESLQDLEGATVALADPLSTPGSLFPLHMLSEAGLDIGDAPQGEPEDFEAQFSDHATAKNQLIERGDVMAAGTGAFETLAHVPREQLPERVAEIALGVDSAGSADPQLDLLAASEPIPRPPIISRRNWEADVRGDVEQALLDAPPEAFTDPDAEVPLWFDGVVEGSIDEYDPVAQVMQDVGISLEDYESG